MSDVFNDTGKQEPVDIKTVSVDMDLPKEERIASLLT